MVMFFYTNPGQTQLSNEKIDNTQFLLSFSGYLLIIGYIVCDSFTSNWQDYMFQTYKLTSLQVMAGVNIWSIFLTLISLIVHGELISSILFGLNRPKFIFDVLTSSLCSAFGQLFIFLTLSQFGAATFVLIMTLRLGLSMILSCIIFSHELHPIAICGVVVVFFGLFSKMFLRQKKPLSLEICGIPGVNNVANEILNRFIIKAISNIVTKSYKEANSIANVSHAVGDLLSKCPVNTLISCLEISSHSTIS
ncbi:solute carrier family 35 (adenosine 3'-phospho 5'-phosphosulfate transporter), member B2 [Schistosoma bovis]|uniref:Adenosine 3'-phospho 5'-phosphosulfate transporter 1 n=1 Tax=Schistosoma bovis TaxID=6184 RepID=A0A430QIY4_SCHBO|nr:solute carrier family 35 (adenosine 3'-phospho 5'-phosphosulfate transporter), member B2 [Schistosoma bovis]